MEPTLSPRRAELLADTMRRFVRRGARAHIAKLLAKTRPEDVALQFRGLTATEQLKVFEILESEYPDAAGEVLSQLEPSLRTGLLEQLRPQQIAGLLEAMPVDDAVEVIESLPTELHREVLDLVDRRELEEVQVHLAYADDSAGRIMDSEFLALADEVTVGEAIAAIQGSKHTENVFYLYVVNRDEQLVGVTSLRQLLLNPPGRPLADIMSRSIIKVHTDTDQEEVARLASRYDLLAIPVTDGSNRLMGIVTVDDIIDVVKEEATEDFMKMVGTSEDELLYQDRSWKTASIRLPWILINLGGLIAAGLLVKHFQVSLKEALFLLTFVPVIMGMGGNIGSQTSTIAVRGLATGRIALGSGQAGQFLWQQLKVGAVLGFACAALAAVGAVLLEGVFKYSTAPVSPGAYGGVVGVSLFLAIVVASINGAFVPLAFQRLGIDPAVAAGPLVTTSNDISGIIIYFGIASLLIDFLVH